MPDLLRDPPRTRLTRLALALTLGLGLLLSARQLIEAESQPEAERPLWVRDVFSALTDELPPGELLFYFSDFEERAHHIRRFSLQFEVVPRTVQDSQDLAVAVAALRAGKPLLVDLAARDDALITALAREGRARVHRSAGPRRVVLLPGAEDS